MYTIYRLAISKYNISWYSYYIICDIIVNTCYCKIRVKSSIIINNIQSLHCIISIHYLYIYIYIYIYIYLYIDSI